MKSIFGDLDQLIEQAVANATNKEKSLQKKQEKAINKKGLDADKKNEKDEVEEASKSEDDETVKKLKGEKSKGADESADDSSVTPGTQTSKKLNDPPEKSLQDPKFSDIQGKVNALRGSGSLSNKDIASSVKSYLSSLSKAERSSLLTYLTNLSQIMATVKKPDQVKDPGEVGISTKFKLKNKQKTDSVKDDETSSAENVIVVGGK